jgi:hypothetical protein
MNIDWHAHTSTHAHPSQAARELNTTFTLDKLRETMARMPKLAPQSDFIIEQPANLGGKMLMICLPKELRDDYHRLKQQRKYQCPYPLHSIIASPVTCIRLSNELTPSDPTVWPPPISQITLPSYHGIKFIEATDKERTAFLASLFAMPEFQAAFNKPKS